MFRRFIDPASVLYGLCRRWSHCRASDGLYIFLELYTPDGLNVFLAVGFFCCYPLGVPYMFQFTSVLTWSFFVWFPVTILFFYFTDILSSGFWSSVSSYNCQVSQLKQKLKLTVLTSRASGTSENYLRAFKRWAEFAKGVLGVPFFLSILCIVPYTVSHFTFFKWLHRCRSGFSYLHPTVIAAKDGALRLVSQPAPIHYSHTLPIWVCAAQRGRDFEAPDLERGIHFRGIF